jgi:uncharacterized membrane protein YfcA
MPGGLAANSDGNSTAVIAVMGLAGIFLPDPAGRAFLLVSIVGAVLGSWLARWLSTKVPTR